MSEKIPEFPRTADSALPSHAACPGGVYLDTRIKPSRRLLLAFGCVYLLAAGAFVVALWPRQMEPISLLVGIFGGLFLLLMVRRQRRYLQQSWRLRIDRYGWHLARGMGVFAKVHLSGSVYLWPGLTCFTLQAPKGPRTHLVLAADSLPKADYHRLRNWLVTQLGR